MRNYLNARGSELLRKKEVRNLSPISLESLNLISTQDFLRSSLYLEGIFEADTLLILWGDSK